MRAQFPGYYRPSDDEFADLWRRCLFVVDANVLLNLYRADTSASTEFIGLLRNLGDRLWVPHQAAWEYHENRLGVLRARATLTQEFEANVEKARRQLDEAIRSLKRHPAIEHEGLLAKADAFFDKVASHLAECRKTQPEMFADEVQGDDPLLDSLTALLDGKVGSPFDDKRLTEVMAEGKRRFVDNRPPGYMDASKEDNPYGDWILWRQVLDHAVAQKAPVVLVTDDDKEDWWRVFQGKRLGPRPELVAEFHGEVGQPFYMYSSNRFAEEAQRHLGQGVSEETVEEIGRARHRVTGRPWPGEAFRGPQACKIVGITYRQLDYWARSELVVPSALDPAGGRLYVYEDLVRLALVKHLLDGGMSLQRARKAGAALGSPIDDSLYLIVEETSFELGDDNDLYEAAKRPGHLWVVPLWHITKRVHEGIARLAGQLPPDDPGGDDDEAA